MPASKPARRSPKQAKKPSIFLVNIHFKGVFFLTQKALPLIADNGRIINLSTGLARFIFAGLRGLRLDERRDRNLYKISRKRSRRTRNYRQCRSRPGSFEPILRKEVFEHAPQVIEFINRKPLWAEPACRTTSAAWSHFSARKMRAGSPPSESKHRAECLYKKIRIWRF